MNPFNVGEKVKIVAKVERNEGKMCDWVPSMDESLNDGIEYSIIRSLYDDRVLLDNGYWYLNECLLPVVERIKGKLKRKVIKKKKITMRSLSNSFKEEVEKHKNLRREGICSYSVATRTGISHHFGDVCHYRIQRADGIIGLLLDLSRLNKDLAYKKATNKQWNPYARYIMRESPWAVAFKTKTLTAGFKSGIKMDVSKPISWIGGACIALRNGTEHAERLYMFNYLISKGIDKHVSYLMSMFLSFDNKRKSFTRTTFGDGHDPISIEHDYNDLIKFFAKGYRNDKELKPATEYSAKYKIFETVGRMYSKFTVNDWLSKNVVESKIGEGWQAVTYITEDEVFRIAKLIHNDIEAAKGVA